ncbi:hypothetical protein SKAU_G00406660 [Synaphobranchus kaupii]|uniref:Regulator of G protein signalling-like domain-containing protein n=1 Tax=Synaphobranchus kaupii TaxID=118154 RepID=A0A9Q1ICX9_SYNKA|nr:hypothetical protein SKAU_G00406660 [Synaphobranchus kaupii]
MAELIYSTSGLFGAQCSSVAMSIIGAEDEFFENDLDPTVDDQCSHFNSIDLLKDRPTHLLVFLQHVMLQFDTAPLMCYLHADIFRSLSAKETKKQFGDFYNTFLDKGAILRVSVPTHVSSEFDHARPDAIGEDMQKRFAVDVQAQLVPDIMRQLEDFKQKRMMGMTPNENELIEVESHHPTERIPTEMKEKAVAETLLEKLPDMPHGIDEDKYTAIFAAIVSYMKHLGVKYRANDGKKSRGFFKKKHHLMKRFEDSTKSRFPWISNEIKAPKPESEGEKEKVATPVRIVVPEPAPLPFSHRKQGSLGGAGSHPGLEGSEGSGVSASGTSSLDSSQTDIGLLSRSETLVVTDVGDVSPAFKGGLTILDSPQTSEPTPEDSQDGDRRKPRWVSTAVERDSQPDLASVHCSQHALRRLNRKQHA